MGGTRLANLVNLDSLADSIAQAADRGQPIVWRTLREPPPATRRLMDALGVRVEVVPVTAAVKVNDRVRVAEGTDGAIVVMGAWCGRCQEESMPDRDGRCMYCRSLIVDEDTLSATEMRRQLGNGSPAPKAADRSAAPAVRTANDVAKQEEEDPMVEPELRKPLKWSRELIVAAIQRWAREHDGKPPTQKDWPRVGEYWPTFSTAAAHFGGWGKALRAAGFDGNVGQGRKAAPTTTSGRGPAKPRTAVEPAETPVPAEATPELLQEPERPAAATAALAPRPDDTPALDWSLALTGQFTRDAQRVRDQAALMRRQADALDVIAGGIDQLEETAT